MIGLCLVGVVICNGIVLALACRNAANREKARQSPNVVDLQQYRFYRRLDVRV